MEGKSDIMSAFHQSQNKNDVSDILKELFDKKKLFMITDITTDEAKLITRIIGIADLMNIPEWNKVVEKYLTLSISKKRLSRAEIIKAIMGFSLHKGFMSRLRGWFGGGE
jgi:hypothetical protein